MNGKVKNFAEIGDTYQTAGSHLTPSSLANPLSKIGTALVPFIGVPFTGSDAIYAWGRLLVYGSVSYLCWKRNKTIAYAAGAAAGVSLATSLANTSWGSL
jgi:hypothetical protein